MRLRNLCLLSLCFLAVPSGCKKKARDQPEDSVPCTAEMKDMKLAAGGINAFALDLYGKAGEGSGNLFFAPFSISTALAMTSAGAGGETLTQMIKVLRFDMEGERLHKALAALSGSLASDKNILKVANRLWGQKGVSFLQPFQDAIKTHYGAELQTLDFMNATEESRKTINAWVEEKTDRVDRPFVFFIKENKADTILFMGRVVDPAG